MIAVAARNLGIGRKAIYERRDKSPMVAEAINEHRELLVDLAEAEIMKQIRGGNIAAIIFTLKTQGRQRGWIERREIEHSGHVRMFSDVLNEIEQAPDEDDEDDGAVELEWE